LPGRTAFPIRDAYGEDSESWIGKRARAWVVKTMVSSKLRNVAYLAAPDWKMLDDGTFIPSDASMPVIDMAEQEEIDPEDIPI
jgi:hypothetical protein